MILTEVLVYLYNCFLYRPDTSCYDKLISILTNSPVSVWRRSHVILMDGPARHDGIVSCICHHWQQTVASVWVLGLGLGTVISYLD